jgi:lipid II:glycine glycyltransferase (peptidoglycan interpeptide bridge formation enzyme)
MSRQTLNSAFRPLFALACERNALESKGYEWLDYLNYVVDLRPPTETLWQNLNRGCRSDIRRAQKRGIRIREATDEEGTELLCNHLRQSYTRSRVPLADVSLFEAASRYLPKDSLRIVIAELDGRPIASASFLVWRGMIYYWYAGIARIPGVAANACLLWDAMEWGSSKGLQDLDLGGPGGPGEQYGPGRFKSQFGGRLVRYGRYRKVYSTWRLWLAEIGYRAAQSLLVSTVKPD